jgi:phosphoesterase RecJ-like protein
MKKLANNSALNEKIRNLLLQTNSFLLTSHIRPDGDAIGSVIALGLALRKLGKDVTIVLADGIPSNFHYLPGSQTTVKTFDKNKKYDLIVSVDSSDQERLGEIFAEQKINLQVDHHITNVMYAEVNYIDSSAVATSSILAECMPGWGLSIDQDIATLLLTGILTDSIGFRTSNTSAKSLRIAADLMDAGANLPSLYHEALVGHSYQQVNYWGFALQRLQKNRNVAWTSLTLADRKQADYNGNDDADLNALLSSITECDFTILFVEQKNNHVKVSWRSKPGFDVSQIAFRFNGGGHFSAAGADIQGELSYVQNLVLQETFAAINEKAN